MGERPGMKGAQLYLYFGEGKGKTTAALGQAVRAWGRGWRVLFVQFLKDSRALSSESAAAAALGPRFNLLRVPQPASVLSDPGPGGKKLLREACRGLLDGAAEFVAHRRCDVVVLDEVLVACHFRFLAVDGVLGFVRSAGGRGRGSSSSRVAGRRRGCCAGPIWRPNWSMFGTRTIAGRGLSMASISDRQL